MEQQKIRPVVGHVPAEYFTLPKEARAEFNKNAIRCIRAFMGFVVMCFNSRN